jgi:hypothetical protein
MAGESPFDHNGECRYCDELGMHRADCSWLLQLQADYTEAVRLYRERDEQAARYHERLQIDPGGSDAIDGLEAAVETLRARLAAKDEELQKANAKVEALRELAERAEDRR